MSDSRQDNDPVPFPGLIWRHTGRLWWKMGTVLPDLN